MALTTRIRNVVSTRLNCPGQILKWTRKKLSVPGVKSTLANRTAASLPYGVSELQGTGLTTAPSSVVKPPRIAESPASLECTEWGTLQIGGNRLIIGLVKRIQVRDELFDPKTARIRSELFQVIGRMASPNWYCRTPDRFEMKRPD